MSPAEEASLKQGAHNPSVALKKLFGILQNERLGLPRTAAGTEDASVNILTQLQAQIPGRALL